jgi:hypothetical protein
VGSAPETTLTMAAPGGTVVALRASERHSLRAASFGATYRRLPVGASVETSAATEVASDGRTGGRGAPPTLESGTPATSAVALGWLMADIGTLEPGAADTTPTGSRLTTPQPRSVLLRRVQTKLNELEPTLVASGLPKDVWNSVDHELGHAIAVDVARLDQAVWSALTAADARLGEAYGIGFDLANLCTLPSLSMSPFDDVFIERLFAVEEALADLASTLPAHASRAVAVSLAQWEYWARDPRLSNEPVAWPHDGVRVALQRQGQVWRSILCGEKLWKDMLRAEDYVNAAKGLTRTLRRWLWPTAALTVAVLGGGIYLLIAQSGTLSKVFGSALSALGVLGISHGTLRRGATGLAAELRADLWSAELDFAIAEAITVPPGDWRVKLKRVPVQPARGIDPEIAHNARRVHEVAAAIARGKLWLWRRRRLREYLHEKCVYLPLGTRATREISGRKEVAKQLLRCRFLATAPRELIAGRPGLLVSRHAGPNSESERNHVWTFEHNKIKRLEEFADYDKARAAAGVQR